jgi:hypothetical protein
MRLVGAALAAGVFLIAGAGLASGQGEAHVEGRVRVVTDGRLWPGHLETIRLAGFPGKGATEVSFFPTAICEDECAARSFTGGRTDAKGRGRFRVRVPGTFLDHRNHPVYFRDGERIDVDVTWQGTDHSFVAGSAEPEPILVRVHGARHG